MSRSCVGAIIVGVFAFASGSIFGENTRCDLPIPYMHSSCLTKRDLGLPRVFRVENKEKPLNDAELFQVIRLKKEKRFFSGHRGHRGHRGDRGRRGPRGHRGFRGHPGKEGSRGPEGPRGAKGRKGSRGPTGPAGSAISAFVQAVIIGGSQDEIKPLPVQNPGPGKVSFETISLVREFVVTDNDTFKTIYPGTYHIQCVLNAYNFLLTQPYDYVTFRIMKNSSTVLRTLSLKFYELHASCYIAHDVLVYLDPGDTISLNYTTPLEVGEPVTYWGVMQVCTPEYLLPPDSLGASMTIVRIGD